MDSLSSPPANKPIRLVLDGSGSHIFAGILDAEHCWLSQVSIDGAALECLFTAVKEALLQANLEFEALGGYIYNAGPGSVLGLRLCAMAIETWSRLFPQSAQFHYYHTLRSVLELLRKDQPDLENALLVADWKTNAWNAVYLQNGIVTPSTVIDTKTLESYEGACFHLPQRKGWQHPPSAARPVRLEPNRLPEIIDTADFLKPSEGVQLYTTAANTFQKWTPQRHKAKSH